MITLTDITKRYGATRALCGVNCSVARGSVVGLLGANGAGKTTLMRIVTGMITDYEGRVRCDASVGYLPEERGLFDDQPIGRQLMFFARMHGMSKTDAEASVRYWLQRFGAARWWNKRPGELSKGMAQKVQFIVAVAHKPELLVLDEPMSGLDPLHAVEIKDIIRELNSGGTTVLFSTHNLSDAQELCTDYIVLRRGAVSYAGPANGMSGEQIIKLL